MLFSSAYGRAGEKDVNKAHPTGAYRSGGAAGGPGQWWEDFCDSCDIFSELCLRLTAAAPRQ